MTLTLGNDEFNTLAEIIAKKVAESIKGSVPEKAKEEPKKEVKTETAKEEVVKKEVVKKEVVKEETKKEESGLSLEQVIKAVKDYTLKDKDGAKKLKPILQSLGVERLSLLPNDKLPEFVEGIRKVGVEI